MLGDGVPLLSSAAMHSMLTPTVRVSGAQNGSHSCGLSWFLRGGEAGEGCGNVFFMRRVYAETLTFTKTGSGQTWEKLRKREMFPLQG